MVDTGWDPREGIFDIYIYIYIRLIVSWLLTMAYSIIHFMHILSTASREFVVASATLLCICIMYYNPQLEDMIFCQQQLEKRLIAACVCSVPIKNFVQFQNRTDLIISSGTDYPVLEPAAPFENWTSTLRLSVRV